MTATPFQPDHDDSQAHGLMVNANEPVEADDTEGHCGYVNTNVPDDDDTEGHGLPMNANEPVAADD
jgi:hypothetical protein